MIKERSLEFWMWTKCFKDTPSSSVVMRRVHPQKSSSVQILNFSLSFISIVAHHSFFEIWLSGRLQYTEILITCRLMAFLCQSQYWPIIQLLLLLLMDGYKCTHMYVSFVDFWEQVLTRTTILKIISWVYKPVKGTLLFLFWLWWYWLFWIKTRWVQLFFSLAVKYWSQYSPSCSYSSYF